MDKLATARQPEIREYQMQYLDDNECNYSGGNSAHKVNN
jgi:hypothetical protein